MCIDITMVGQIQVWYQTDCDVPGSTLQESYCVLLFQTYVQVDNRLVPTGNVNLVQ